MASDPRDLRPGGHGRTDLPDLREKRAPVGYRRGFDFGERLLGVLAVLLGAAGLVLIPILLGSPPPGAPAALPTAGSGPLPCLVPLIAAASVGLVLVGLKRIVRP